MQPGDAEPLSSLSPSNPSLNLGWPVFSSFSQATSFFPYSARVLSNVQTFCPVQFIPRVRTPRQLTPCPFRDPSQLQRGSAPRTSQSSSSKKTAGASRHATGGLFQKRSLLLPLRRTASGSYRLFDFRPKLCRIYLTKSGPIIEGGSLLRILHLNRTKWVE
jgi:hypothetical protein